MINVFGFDKKFFYLAYSRFFHYNLAIRFIINNFLVSASIYYIYNVKFIVNKFLTFASIYSKFVEFSINNFLVSISRRNNL